MSPLGAQLHAEVTMTLRRGESVLLVLGIPLALLTFFSLVDVLPTGESKPVNFLLPGIMGLAILSTAFTSLAISTGFERQYGVLKRVGITPLGRSRLIIAKIGAVMILETIQLLLLALVGYALGWRGHALGESLISLVAVLLATCAFSGLGLCLAGVAKAEVTLAGANALYLVLMLSSGLIFSLEKLGTTAAAVMRLFPVAPLADLLRVGFSGDGTFHQLGAKPWIVLTIWATVSPIIASRIFRWE